VKNGWTGGQYSLYRAVFGVYLFIHFLSRIPRAGEVFPNMPLLAVAAVASLFFIAGLHDRVAAVVMLCVLAWLLGPNPLANLSLLLVAWLLLAHTLLPPAPFLSVAARRRVDPRGGWSMPPAIVAASWIVLSLGWTAVLVMHLPAPGFALVFLHLFTFDPAWIPRKLPETTDTVFYDGTCGLCHRGMRFLVAEDPIGTSFRYAPLGGDAFAAQFPDPGNLPDSVIVQTPAGETLVRSDAAVYLLQRLGGLWRILGILFAVLPKRMRDAMYDFVARVRYRIFGREKDACPIIPPDLRSRFSA